MRYYSLYKIRYDDTCMYLSCRFTSAMVVHVPDLHVTALQEVQGKMSLHVTEWGAMESSGLLG